MQLSALPNLSNGQLATIITGWNTNASKIYKILTGKIKVRIGNKSQSRDKILYILLAFVFYLVMMVAIAND